MLDRFRMNGFPYWQVAILLILVILSVYVHLVRESEKITKISFTGTETGVIGEVQLEITAEKNNSFIGAIPGGLNESYTMYGTVTTTYANETTKTAIYTANNPWAKSTNLCDPNGPAWSCLAFEIVTMDNTLKLNCYPGCNITSMKEPHKFLPYYDPSPAVPK